MKNAKLFALMLILIISFVSCQKQETPIIQPIFSVLPTVMIATEACFRPNYISLILAHPDDYFYYENKENYQVDWFKNDLFLKTAPRINCVGNGQYRAVVTFLKQNQIQEQNYEVAFNLDDL